MTVTSLGMQIARSPSNAAMSSMRLEVVFSAHPVSSIRVVELRTIAHQPPDPVLLSALPSVIIVMLKVLLRFR